MENSGKPENIYTAKVGYGQCMEDFTIKEMPVACFVEVKDAEKFVKAETFDPVIFSGGRIYYIDLQVQDSSGMIPVRYIFDQDINEFVEGVKAKNVRIPGYHVRATYSWNDDEEGYEIETTTCVSYRKAEEVRKQYVKDGADVVEIFDDVDIRVMDEFWGAEKFFRGELRETQHNIT